MSILKLLFFISSFAILSFSCSAPDRAQCACLEQAQKVNRLTQAVWNKSASHQDSLLLSKALQKKDKLCKKLQEAAPETLHELQALCPH
jgi:hypothetical protein